MATRRRVVWSERARDSLDEVLSYIAKDSHEGAQSVARSAIELAASLATLAERGRVVPELGDPSIREVFAFRYRLMQRIEAAPVTVVAFIHGARDFDRWRREVEQQRFTLPNKALELTGLRPIEPWQHAGGER